MAIKEYISEQDFFDYWMSFPKQEDMDKQEEPGTAWRNGHAHDMRVTYFGEHYWFCISYPHKGWKPCIMFFKYPKKGKRFMKCMYQTQINIENINELHELAYKLMCDASEKEEE